MKKIIKFATVAALILALAFSAFGCTDGGNTNAPDGNNTEEVKDMTLFENGKTDYTIVYPDERTEAEEYAASTLKEFFKEVSGASISLKQEKFVTYSDDAKIISVGGTRFIEKAGINAELEHDGFFIKTAGSNLFINGGSGRGTLYGVYEFLDAYLGVKFLTYDYTYTPKLNEYKFGKIDDVQAPSFAYRNFMVAGYNDDKAYMSRMRFVNEYHTVADRFGGNIGWFSSSDCPPAHNSLSYVSTSYASREPEMFSFVGGKPVEICQTYGITESGEIDDGVELSPIKLAIESLKKFVLAAKSDVTYFMFGQQDVQTPCRCARCMRDTEKYGRGGINIRFVNLLAREVQKWANEELNGREVNVITFAYQYSEEPPVELGKNGEYRPIDQTVVAADNVSVRLATYFCNGYYSLEDSRQIAKYRTLLSNWSKVASKFMLWDYHIDYYNYFNYYPTMQTWKENLRLYKSIGAEYVLMQSAQNEKVSWQANMEAYVASKLMWNIERDIDELVNEFFTYYYGIAKDYALKYKTDADLYYRTLFEHFDDYTLVLGSDRSAVKYYDISFLKGQEGLMNEAIDYVSASELADDEKQTLIKRLKIMRAPVKFMIMHNYNGYYLDKQSEYKAYVDGVLAELAELGFARYSEGSLLNEYKANHRI